MPALAVAHSSASPTVHICLQTVADVSDWLGYSGPMRHKKYVRAYPPLSDFSKLDSAAEPKRWLWSLRWWLPLTALLLLVMVSCGGGSGGAITAADANAGLPNPPSANPAPGPAGALLVSEITTALNSPWSMAFLPDGSALVTEKAGTLRIVSTAGSVSAAISGVPAVDARGQGGLLDVALDPAFATNQRIYLSFAKPSASAADGNHTVVARAVLNTATLALSQVTVIFEQQPKVVSTGHYGSRLVFDKNGYLFVTLGDRQSNDQRGFAQDLARGNGKVMRITTDGAAAPGNPNLGASAQSTIWSYGHRNP